MKTAYDIIIRPVITEQSMEATELKKYVFLVAESANKTEIIAPVPGFIPGIRPIMLLIRMNRKSEHRNGKCFFQFSPTTPLPISFSTYSMMYSKPLTKKPLA